MTKISILFLFSLFTCSSSAFLENDITPTDEFAGKPIFDKVIEGQDEIKSQDLTIEQRLKQMTLDEKIGQLFWVDVFCNKGQAEITAKQKLIQDYHIGGITWFRDTKKTSSPTKQLNYTNQLQRAAKYPLIVSIDGEWGLNMRLDSTVQFPRQLALGAIQDDQVVYEFGQEVGRQMKRMGIHVNFAPVIDVNNNINNPVINDRSFGEDIYNVTNKGIAYMNGMHDSGILATAKHFPGHGDTDTDSHLDLPIINHTRERLDSLELYPFQQLIQARIGAVMVAHLNVPALDSTINRPTTLSKPVVTDLLQNELGFDGLVITDAMVMQGVTKHFPPGRAEVEALKAGNDILLYSGNVKTAIAAIKTAIANGELTEERINKSVFKILAAKRWLGILDSNNQLPANNLVADLTQAKVELLNQKLYENAVTLVHNHRNTLPFTDLSGHNIATVNIDNGKQNRFQSTLGLYAPMKHFTIKMNAKESEFTALKKQLEAYNTVIISLNNKSRYSKKQFGISQASRNFIQELNNKSIVAVFGNPYSLGYFSNVQELIVAYDGSETAQIATAENIFGVNAFLGKTPVGVLGIPYGTGITTYGNLRLKYTRPESLNYPADILYQVDSIALDGIAKGAYPGCQILIAKDNQVIYNKAFGHFTFNKNKRVNTSNLYDLASITKIAASMPVIMKGYEEGFFTPTMTLQEINPIFASSNKKYFQAGDILNHTSGLKAWIPFYLNTLTKDGKLNELYKRTPTTGYSQVANKIYITNNFERDSILYRIKEANNGTIGKYKYSDLGFYIFKDYFERIHNQPFEDHLDQSFYRRVGFPSLTYNPLNKFPKSKIVPSEKDDYYRNQTVQGYVHDMGAAMLGGVGGHAGLFGNTNDVAMYLQLLLNKGYYGGVQYFNSSTVDFFTTRYNQNSRKAMGFDKPELDSTKIGPTCIYVSPDSFGHTGFTGTFAWADPANNILMVFLSNRTYPTQKNRKLLSMSIRPQIQEAAWRALDPTCKPYY